MRRREFIFALGGAAAWPLSARAQARVSVRRSVKQQSVTDSAVTEITMVRPDLVRVEVKDAPVTKGPLVGPVTPEASYGMIQRTNPITGAVQWCSPRGPKKDHLKFVDRRPTEADFLNRAAAADVTGYGAIGERTVTAVYPHILPYDAGSTRGRGGGDAKLVSMRHWLYLQLDRPLAAGNHSITFPTGTGLGSVPFPHDDKRTRACSIQTNQVGHRPKDICKLGYLGGIWVPYAPNEGAVSHDHPVFHVINDQGTSIFNGPITLRTGPTDVEYGYGGAAGEVFYGEDPLLHRWLNGLERRPSLNTKPLKVTAITKANPGVVTYSGDSFVPVDGDILAFRGIGGMSQLEGAFVKISKHNSAAKTFSIDRDTSKYGTYAPNSWLSDYDSLIHRTHLCNRVGSYVYGLDYSACVFPRNGFYRLWIPSLGVSDEFEVSDAVWFRVAKKALGALYNQRNGIALDGRFGYERPISFRDGVDGVVIYKSTLPAVFSSEGVANSPVLIASALGSKNPWITGERMLGLYGGHHDAGDWDTHLHYHARGYYELLDKGVEFAHPAARNTEFGTPKSGQVLDPVLYAGTDHMPDAWHEAMWGLDLYRRMQNPDGSVQSGIGYSNGGTTEPGSGPSWLPVANSAGVTAYAYAPDHIGNMAYVVIAAKAAAICYKEGLNPLGEVWRDSALAAWRWARPLWHDSAAYDAYYNGVLGVQQKAGWTTDQYTKVKTFFFSPTLTQWWLPLLRAAAATLFRLTGDAQYGVLADKEVGYPPQGWRGPLMWEYFNAVNANPTVKGHYRHQLTRYMHRAVIDASLAEKRAYRNQNYLGTGTVTMHAEMPFVLWSMYLSDDKTKHLNVMQAASGFVLGANPSGQSMMTGIGARHMTETLHEDSKRRGHTPPPGIVHYGWDPGFWAAALNLSTDSPLNFTVHLPTGKFEVEFGTKRIVHPWYLAHPKMQWLPENRLFIHVMEYTWHQTCLAEFTRAFALHSWDGNTATGN